MLKSKFTKILFFSFILISFAIIALSSVIQIGLLDYDDRKKLIERINRYIPFTKKIMHEIKLSFGKLSDESSIIKLLLFFNLSFGCFVLL